MAAASTRSTSTVTWGADALEHWYTKVLRGNAAIESARKINPELNQIKTLDDLIELCTDNLDVINALKFRTKNKPGQNTNEDLPDKHKKAFIALPYYINWLQTNYATHSFPVPFEEKANFPSFTAFQQQTKGQEFVYDDIKARESEKFHQLGTFAPSSTTGTASNTMGGSTGGSSGYNSKMSPEEMKLLNFEKKTMPTKTVTLGDTDSWSKFQYGFKGMLILRGISHLIDPNYVAPVDGVDDPAKCELYKRENTLLYFMLEECVTSELGKLDVLDHIHDQNGVGTWIDLESTFANGSLTAKQDARHYRKILNTMKPVFPITSYVSGIINRFRIVVQQHNACCDPGEVIKGEKLLDLFEEFIMEVRELKNMLDIIDINELGIATALTPAKKMAAYKKKCQQLDQDMKTRVLSSRKSKSDFRTRRMVNQAHVSPSEIDVMEYQGFDPFAEENAVEFQAFAAEQQISHAAGDYDEHVESDSSPTWFAFVGETEVASTKDLEARARRYGMLSPEAYRALPPAAQRNFMSYFKKHEREHLVTNGQSAVARAALSSSTADDMSNALVVPSGNRARSRGSSNTAKRPGRGILRNSGTSNGARTAAQVVAEPEVPVDDEDDEVEVDMALNQVSEPTISAAIANETFGPTAFLDTIVGTRSAFSATARSDADEDMKKMAYDDPAGSMRRTLSRYALDNTPTTLIRRDNDDEVTPIVAPETCDVKKVLTDAAFPDIMIGNCDEYDPDDYETRIVAMAVMSSIASDLEGDLVPPDTDECVSINVVAAHLMVMSGLLDGGANGGLAHPKEMKVLFLADPSRRINVNGVGGTLTGLPIGTVAVKYTCTDGQKVIGIHHEMGILPPDHKGHTIHSRLQLRDGGCEICDDPRVLGGKQCIIKDGRELALDYRNGLPFLKGEYPSEDDLLDLQHIVMTRDVPWDPSRYDSDLSSTNPVIPLPPSASAVQHMYPGFNDRGELIEAHYGETERGFDILKDIAVPPLSSTAVTFLEMPSVTTVQTIDSAVHFIETPTATSVHFVGSDQPVTCGVNSAVGSRRVPSTGELLPEPTGGAFPFDPGGGSSLYALTDIYAPTMHTELYSNVHTLSDLNLEANYGETTLSPIEFEAYRPFFLGVPTTTVAKTFAATTRYYRHLPKTRHFMAYKSPYPALNVLRRHELVASDTVFADVIAWGGYRAAQVFSGKLSRFISVHGCQTDKDFARCLENEIRKRGAMDKLCTDRAKAETSKRVEELLRIFCIDDWQSEPYYHHQLFVERDIQTLKKFSNWVLNWSNAPPEAWLLVFEYVAHIMNKTAKESLGWRTPSEALNHQTPDISPLLHFTFWEPVFIDNYRRKGDGKQFPSESDEIIVRFVGYSEDVGHSCTYKVFNEETKEVLYRSCLRKVDPVLDVKNVPPYNPGGSGCPADINDESIPEVIKILNEDDPTKRKVGLIMPEELIGRTFLMNVNEDGTRNRAEILDYELVSDAVDDFDREVERHPERVKFRVRVGDTDMEEYVGYNDMCEFIERQCVEEDGTTWKFRKLVGHKRTLKPGEQPQVLVMWESGEITFEPIREIAKADPYLVAEYAMDAGVIDDWHKRMPRLKLKQHAKNAKKMMRMINQAKLRSYRTTPIYMFGVEVPRNHEQAVKLDEKNGDTKWQDAEKLEIEQLFEYNCFEDRGHKSTATVPRDYKRIRLHMVYACKHDGRRKARCVAGGHLTDVPNESVYSGVVSLRGIRLLLLIAELNDMKVWATDIGNAFLESKTNEKVYVIAGGEFGDLKDHVLIIIRALYGLRTSSKRFWERLGDVLREMGFVPCPAEPDIWMRAMNPDGTVMTKEDLEREKPTFEHAKVSTPMFNGYYEYIATYIDDLTIVSKNPEAIIRYLEVDAKFKLKGTGPLSFLLGCDYYRDEEGVLCAIPKKYIQRMESTYERLFGEKPKHYYSPLEPNDHPELDISPFCGEEDTKIYQSLIGALQWIISLGRFDICVHVMSLSSFRVKPRTGHLSRVKRIYGYISKFKHAAIRYLTGIPDFKDIKFEEHDWSRTVYAGATEEYPSNSPPARGKPVLQYSYVDANLYHDMLSGKAVTAILHFVNQTPIDWYSKKQATVETATFGSENTAARTCIEQMKDLKYTLLALGVPVYDRSIMIGDNETVVKSGTIPHVKLHKRHLMLSYHYVREAIATGNYAFCWLSGKLNPADILSKHWGYQSVWSLLQPLMFWKGDTVKLKVEEKEKEMKKNGEKSIGEKNGENKST